MIDNKFEVLRDEDEHRDNPLHKEIKEQYEYYLKMGVSKKWACKYSKWNYLNLVKKQEGD